MSVSVIKLENNSHLKGFSSVIYRAEPKQECVIDKTSFLAEALYKEVVNQDQLSGKNRKLKYLKKLHKGYMSMLVTLMMVSPASVFAEGNSSYQNLISTSNNNEEITPNLVMEWGFSLALTTVAVGVALAGSLLALAGVYRMLRKKREAEEWTTDIIKGLVQVLIAIPVVYSLFYLAQMVFKRIPFLEGLL